MRNLISSHTNPCPITSIASPIPCTASRSRIHAVRSDPVRFLPCFARSDFPSFGTLRQPTPPQRFGFSPRTPPASSCRPRLRHLTTERGGKLRVCRDASVDPGRNAPCPPSFPSSLLRRARFLSSPSPSPLGEEVSGGSYRHASDILCHPTVGIRENMAIFWYEGTGREEHEGGRA